MQIQNVLTIFRKDVREAIQDSRVLVAILVPLGIGIFYGLTFEDEVIERPEATVSYVATSSALPDALGAVTGQAVDLTFDVAATPDEVRQAVDDESADIGLIAPDDFSAQVQQGQSPDLTVILPDSPSTGAQYVTASLDAALRQLAGRSPPANIQVETLPAPEEESVFEQLGPRRYFVMVGAVFVVAMISLFVVPIILTEEAEKKTLDAVTMVASYADVIAGKALVGIVYTAIAVPLLLAVTQLMPDAPLLFGGGMLLLSITLIGFGLLIGGLFRSANQLNTWAGVLILPVIAPTFLLGFELPTIAEVALALYPISAAMKLAINGLSGTEVFANAWLSVLVIIVWAAAAYLILGWTLRRREA